MYTGYLQVAMGQQSDWILAAGADPRKAVGTLLWHVPSGRTRVVPGVGWPAAISRDRFAAWDPKKKSIVTMDLESAQVISTLAVDAPPTAMCLAGGHFLLHSDARQDAWKLRIKRLSDGEELQVIRSPDLGDIASAFYSPDCKAIGFATRRLAGMAFWTARLDRLE
jgi:hypothetical protein